MGEEEEFVELWGKGKTWVLIIIIIIIIMMTSLLIIMPLFNNF
jgi:flagellar basal body-associated protein FliL